MSKFFTTGEIAKLCNISVRTVQYYDGRGILSPTEISEGGRRLYSEQDLSKMKSICFLRELGFSLNNISALFLEENPEKVIDTLLGEQEKLLREDLDECQEKLNLLKELRSQIKSVTNFSVESISDMAHFMKDRNKLTKMHWMMILTGIPVTALQWVAIILWATSGLWWLFPIWVCVVIPWGIFVTKYYFDHVAYICPECHETFKPKLKEVFWANHTPKTRRLTCPKCGKKSFCVEVYYENKKRDN